MIVFLNGAFIAEEDAALSPFDRGFTLGDGVFDTLRADNGEPVDAHRHFMRLLDHAGQLRLYPDITMAELKATAQALLEKNDFTMGHHAVRTVITRGSAPRGLLPPEPAKPLLLMTAAPVPAPSATPLTLITAQSVRRNEYSQLSRIKSLNYADNMLAAMEAFEKGADDALMLNTKGHVTCATTSNIFVVRGGRLLTPPLADGVMDGVTRTHLMVMNEVTEQSLTLDDLYAAEGVFLSSSIRGLRPVARLDGHAYGDCAYQWRE